jgi:hypothetical protein
MSGNIEARLRKLELEAGHRLNAPKIIVLHRDDSEDLAAILAANNVTHGENDLIISIARGLAGEVPFLPFTQRIISIQETRA